MTDRDLARALRDGFEGRVIGPDDADYDEARKVWNGMIDRRPAVVARCAGTADVVRAVRFAGERGLPMAIRGGGHNVSGNAVCDDGLVVDLRDMKRVVVDPDRRIARAEGGATWGDYDAATQAHGLASPGGAISSTGIAGLTLGGGFGWLSRSYGLACDNLLSAEVVTADGEIRTASEERDPDLYWGIRGGGGNFGVVTRFDYRLHEVSPPYAGLVLYPRSDARPFLRMYREQTGAAPDRLSSMAAFLSSPDGDPVVGAFFVYHGPEDEGKRALAGVREFGTPLFDDVATKPYTEVQRAFDPGFPAGCRNYWKSNYLNDLDDACIDRLIEHAERAPSPMCVVGVEHMMGGAVARVPAEATAFGTRDAVYNLLILGMAEDPALDGAIRDWTRSMWEAMQPFSTGGVYVNYMDRDEADRVADAYGAEHYDRLTRLKKKYDPDNRFHLNQNIAPAG